MIVGSANKDVVKKVIALTTRKRRTRNDEACMGFLYLYSKDLGRGTKFQPNRAWTERQVFGIRSMLERSKDVSVRS